MSKLQYYNYPGWGEAAKDNYSQAVRVGNVIKLSGQENDMSFMQVVGDADSNFPESEEEQVANAFKNIETALRAAGVQKPFESICNIRSYHVGLHDGTLELIVCFIRKLMPNHRPIWTMVGVERLAVGAMRVEIEVDAVAD